MPSDITGTEVIQEDRRTGSRSFRFLPGPVFANVLLADEVNRTPPKTQAALLEAMQEQQVTVGGVRHALEPPFFVLATQNPIEQEGTYPLPEAQQDRFMFKVLVEYPSYEDEFTIAERTTTGSLPDLEPLLQRDEILHLQDVVRRVPVAPRVLHYALGLVRATRPNQDGHPAQELMQRLVTYGAGPRAVQFLLLGAKVRAVLNGRQHVATEDVQALAAPVLRHRIITNYAAEAEGFGPDRIIAQLLEALPPTAATDRDLRGVFEEQSR
jgi:MoxR-like ATPase